MEEDLKKKKTSKFRKLLAEVQIELVSNISSAMVGYDEAAQCIDLSNRGLFDKVWSMRAMAIKGTNLMEDWEALALLCSKNDMDKRYGWACG